MKTIPYVAPVKCVNTKGEPWPSAQDQKVLTQKEFLLDQVGAEGFAAPRKGIKQVRFQLAVMAAIEQTPDGLSYELENEHHAALVAADDKAEYMSAVAHCLLPFLEALEGG